MSLHPKPIPPIPEDTARVARAAFPKGNIYLQLRNTLETIYVDEDFADLFSVKGKPAQSPWRLALICIMQYMENLSDRQVAEAVRGRIDWKYVLSLPLEDSGFDYSVLSEFRKRLIESGKEELLLNKIIEKIEEVGLLKKPKRQRTDSTHIIAAIRPLNRLECLGEMMRAALNSLAKAAPDWLKVNVKKDWFDRYGRRMESYRLPDPKSEREKLGNQMGADGFYLLEKIYSIEAPQGLRFLLAVETLRKVWIQQFYAPVDGIVQWRSQKDLPPASIAIHSPYDLEARYSSKRSVNWVGYKVHLTETCDEDSPHLITQVETTLATLTDEEAVKPIHQDLEKKDLLPDEHLMDMGYTTADNLMSPQKDYDVRIIGPVRSEPSWQARNHPQFAAENFHIDWEQQVAICPEGHQSHSWRPTKDRGGLGVIQIQFSSSSCKNCSARSQCTRAKKDGRKLTIREKERYIALKNRRKEQDDPEFLKIYHKRAGIEGTLSQALRKSGLRQSRYVGLAKTHLQHILTAAALNLYRLDNWLNDILRASTRYSRFYALKPKKG
ncbi:IS1182 family transposase [Crocosphaera sp. Alani8]|uniref:IS1182 family transposase n=1 Tax=Crocosphaera sp. Alani8 TaxID=3038952 RepID=UPI00313B6C50